MRPTGRPRKDAPAFDVTHLTRYCLYCESSYEKPDNQPWGRWMVRKYCSQMCYKSNERERR